jgi:hypothetical protein
MKRDVDRSYLAIVVLLMLVLPLASLLIETREPGLVLVGKWWNFWAIGVRLFTAGLRQVAKPAFTAEVIFHATMQIFARGELFIMDEPNAKVVATGDTILVPLDGTTTSS